VLTRGDRLGNDATRRAVVGALDSFFSEWPHGLSRMLDSEDLDVVLAGLDLASRLKRPEFVDVVGQTASHADPRVRRHAARTLAALGSAAAYRRLLGMADDADRDVRILVYRTFAARPFRGAFRSLERAITKADLESKGDREKRILFEAFGAVAGPEGITVLAPLLRGKNPSGARPSAHTRACAATGLGFVGTPAAREELRAAAQDRDPLVRSAVSAALRGEH
jgi:HEAT repeat protein